MTIDVDDLLDLYAQGAFPMADSAEDEHFAIVAPEWRSVLPIEGFKVPTRLRRTVRTGPFEIRINTAFNDVITACAEQKSEKRATTWINRPIRDLFNAAHARGYAHSVEAWKGGRLVGGLYGLQVGAAFCGESMFSKERDASKVALVHLVARLWKTGFTLLDAQLKNNHLAQFGQEVITQEVYVGRLKTALAHRPDFTAKFDEQVLVRGFLSLNAPGP